MIIKLEKVIGNTTMSHGNRALFFEAYFGCLGELDVQEAIRIRGFETKRELNGFSGQIMAATCDFYKNHDKSFAYHTNEQDLTYVVERVA